MRVLELVSTVISLAIYVLLSVMTSDATERDT